MKKVASIIVCVIFGITFMLNSYAQSTAIIISETINQDTQDEQLITICIDDNPGIMGFKLHFEYSDDSVEIISAQKGEVTKKGNLNHNIGNKNGSFDVMWNNTSDTILNGAIVVLRVKSLTDKPFKITVSYSQADTFNEQYQDVVLKCNDIISSNCLSEIDEVITTEKSPDEIVGITDELLVDIISTALEDNKVESLVDISEKTKNNILISVNQQIESVTNQKNYYDSFEELKKDYIRLLKDKLINDAELLDTNDTPKDIIDSYMQDNNYVTINSENVGGLISAFEQQGLDSVYSDYLTEDDLQEVFNQISENDGLSNKKISNNRFDLLIIILVVISALVICCVIVILNVRRKKNEE